MAVEKLLPEKFAKIKLRQDALQTTFLFFLDVFYPLNFGCLEENGVFQQPLAITLIDRAYQCYFPRYAPTILAQASTKSCSDLVNVPSK